MPKLNNGAANLESAPEPAPDYSDLEPLLNDAAGLSVALAAAIEGIGRLALEAEDQQHALATLAYEAQYAAVKARKLWYAANANLAANLQ